VFNPTKGDPMNVSISEGLRLDDDTAHRFAKRMLLDLRPHFARATKSLRAISDFGSIGNPLGQRRTFERLAKVYGPLLIYSGIDTGKRGHYLVRFVSFATYGETLGLDLVSFHGNGFKQEPGFSNKPIITFSLHALARLIQRAGIRTGDDYIPMFHDIVGNVLIAGACMNTAISKDPAFDETWPVPVSIKGTPAILLVTRSGEGPWVKTVYPAKWRDLPEFDGLDTSRFLYMTTTDFKRWTDAFRRAAPRFTRETL
jgi:hypothetical protein